MTGAAHFVDEPATLGDVLNALRDRRRLHCASTGLGDPTIELTLGMPMPALFNAFGGEGYVHGALSALVTFEDSVDLPRGEVQKLQRNFSDRYSQTLAEHLAALTPYLQPRHRLRAATFAGKPCRAAGAFLALRTLLVRGGVSEATQLAPSTPLSPFLRQHYWALGLQLSRLAPGALPPIQIVPISNPWPERGMNLGCGGALLALVGVWVGFTLASLSLSLTAATLFARSLFLHYQCLRLAVPDAVAFGELETFRDLATFIADYDAKYDQLAAAVHG